MTHIISDDCYGHIKDLGCYCNPRLVCVEGEELIIHNNNYVYQEGDREVRDVVRQGDYFTVVVQ